MRASAVEERKAAVAEAQIIRDTMEVGTPYRLLKPRRSCVEWRTTAFVVQESSGATPMFFIRFRHGSFLHPGTLFNCFFHPVISDCGLQRGKEQAQAVEKQLHDLVEANATRLATNTAVATEVCGLGARLNFPRLQV